MKRAILIVIAVVALAAVVWSFMASRKEATQEAERERPIQAPSRISVVNGSTVIKIDAETQRRSGIETAKATRADYREELRAYATALDLTRLTQLFNSHATAQADVRAARARLEVSQTAFERAKMLYKDEQNVSLARLQEAEATYRSDLASEAASESRVGTLAATAGQEWGPVLAKALVQREALLTRLMDQQDILLQVTLPPGVALRNVPSHAAAQAGRQTRIALRLLSRAPRTDPKIQGTSFLYVASARSGLLPGMSVPAYLATGQTTRGAIVPNDAIVWWQDRAWIYRRTSPQLFTRIQIDTERPTTGGYVVTELAPGSEIVTRGAQLLLSEEFRAQIRVAE